MIMTRQHFKKIAQIIRDFPYLSDAERQNMAKQFAAGLSETNPAFKKDKFISACMEE